MRVLVIEDDENKRTKILTFIKELLKEPEIDIARSYQSGIRCILSQCPDWILLDMAMPTFDISKEDDGGQPQPFAGREILRQMKRRGISVPTVVVTQFDRFGEAGDSLTLQELDRQMREEHPSVYRGSVYFDVTYDGWKDALAACMGISDNRHQRTLGS